MSELSSYFTKLKAEYPDVAARYEEKLGLLGDVDPFSIPHNDLSYDAKDFPPVTNMDLVTYLVLTTSFYTKEQCKAFKSLTAYKYFEAGFVTKCGVAERNKYKVVVGEVKHSQRMKETPLNAWVIVHFDGSIETAHCTCMAGAGEVCSHVGALLYAVQYIANAQSTMSCTDFKSLWNIPKLSEVRCQPLKSMEFHRTVSSASINYDVPALTKEELLRSLQNIKDSGGSSALMRVTEPFASEWESTSLLKNPYKELFNSEYEILNLEQLLQIACQYTEINISQADCNQIERATRDQRNSAEWFHQRAGWVTASQLKRVCCTSLTKPSLSLIKQICYPIKYAFKTKETEWGLNHEDVALDAYTRDANQQHENVSVRKIGLIIDPNLPQFGASPDALVRCNCCGVGCVEVKCPYLLKTMSITQYAEKRTTFLVLENNEIYVDKKHAYYYQIQQQMALSATKYCDIVVWSPNEFLVERVPFNEDFWAHYQAVAESFHTKVIMPELLGRLFTRSTPSFPTWCICQEPDDGRPMLCCASDTCNILWYHLECVKLTDVPEDRWVCDFCKNVL